MAEYGDTRIEITDGIEYVLFNQTKSVENWIKCKEVIRLPPEELQRWNEADKNCRLPSVRFLGPFIVSSFLLLLVMAGVLGYGAHLLWGKKIELAGLIGVAVSVAVYYPAYFGCVDIIFQYDKKKLMERDRARAEILATVGSSAIVDSDFHKKYLVLPI